MITNDNRIIGADAVPDRSVLPVTIGDPGRAFHEVEPLLFAQRWTHADTEVDGGRFDGLSVRAASIRGLSHRQGGTPRQDAYGFAAGGGWFVAAVADGVSSGPLSHEAARLVTRYGPQEVVDRLAEAGGDRELVDWHALFERLGQRILRVGARSLARGGEPVESQDVDRAVIGAMSTTATFVICEAFGGEGTRRASVAWLGDSPAWLLRSDGSWFCLSEVKGAGQDVASSSVSALPLIPQDTLPTRHFELDPGDVALIMSDGVGDPLGDADGEVAAYLARAWRTPPGQLDFAAQAGFGRKAYDDDRTVVGIWPETPARP